jgi:hypothetical protein
MRDSVLFLEYEMPDGSKIGTVYINSASGRHRSAGFPASMPGSLTGTRTSQIETPDGPKVSGLNNQAVAVVQRIFLRVHLLGAAGNQDVSTETASLFC